MKNKYLIGIMIVILFFVVGCSKNVEEEKKYEVALVTDATNIDDGSFNEGVWDGIKDYCLEKDITYNYYIPDGDTSVQHKETIDNAIQKGAKIVITPGFSFAQTINELQNDDKYKSVQFLLIDAVPTDKCNNPTVIRKNVHCISYKEEQAGFLVGYAAVKEGSKKLGFLGGKPIPPVQRYGYGFVQGADVAAKELGISEKVEVNYFYTDSFMPSDDIYNKVSEWYKYGTETVFSCGGKIYQSAIKAAEEANKYVIGVDSDQFRDSDTIMTSAIKEISKSINIALTSLYNNKGTWPEELAGNLSTYGVENDGIGLPISKESWKFKQFTKEEYDFILNNIKVGEVSVSNNVSNAPLVSIKVNYEQ